MIRKLILFFGTSSIIFQNLSAADPVDWDAEYKKLCSYDATFCRKVRNSDGTFVKPKKEILALMKELAPLIQSSAKTLGVDPRAIAGSIVAENSLNVGITDDVQSLLVKIGVADKGNILGKKFSYGLGQLNFSAAREAEDYAALLEKRRPLSDKDLQDAILTPEKSIYLVGAVIRKVQDDYKKQGIDISDRPEILTTLYNLGRSEEKAAQTKKSGNLPKPNYFGFFVSKHINDLAYLKKAETSAPITKKAEKSEVAVITTPAVKDAVSGDKNKNVTATAPVAAVTKKLKMAFTKSVPLYSSPPVCTNGNTEYGATDLEKKYNNMKSFAVTAIAEKEKSYSVLAPAIDCETNPWQLVKLASGEVGWIKKADLEKHTAKIMVEDERCKPVVDLKCAEKVNDQLKNLSLTEKKKIKGSEIFAKPFSKNETASFASADWQCVDKKMENDSGSNALIGGQIFTGSGMGLMGGMNSGSAAWKPSKLNIKNDLNVLVETLNEFEKKEKEIEKKYNKSLENPENPFSILGLPSLKSKLNFCVNKQKYNLGDCKVNLESLNKVLTDISIDQRPTKEDKELIAYNFNISMMGSDQLETKESLRKKSNVGMGGFFGSFPILIGVSPQYDLKDGDESKWSASDLDIAFKECNKSLESIKEDVNKSNKIEQNEQKSMIKILNEIKAKTISPAEKALLEIEKMDKEKKENVWSMLQPELIRTAKMCLSLEDLFQIQKTDKLSTEITNSYSCYFSGLNILANQNELMLKDIMRESLFSSSGLKDLQVQFMSAFNEYVMGVFVGTNNFPLNTVVIEKKPSYCPNKTAEIIEEIVKNNSCVQRIYVPDRWLINRLNELGEKVIYKPFAEDDRYSFDLEKTQCN